MREKTNLTEEKCSENPYCAGFCARVLDWFARHGRKDLPWQVEDPYAVWVSEIMLQQTQVAKVLDYYARFMQRFPTLGHVAEASEDEVLALWSGLGYYNRARYLHRAAQICVEKHAGALPSSLDALMALPGIGRSTAGAILSLSGQGAYPVLDGNVKRLFARYFAVDGDTGGGNTLRTLWQLAEAHVPLRHCGKYNQALMDLGATVCTRGKPQCLHCPLQASCGAFQAGRVHELPAAKRKQSSRKVTLYLAVLMRQGADGPEVFLQQRNTSGIWPGLWFVPVFDDEQALRQWQQCHDVNVGQQLPVVEHVLTHRRLQLYPFCTWVQADVADRLEGRWLAVDKLDEVAHPRALSRLLDKYRDLMGGWMITVAGL